MHTGETSKKKRKEKKRKEKTSKKKKMRTHIFSVFVHFCKQYPSRDHIKTHYGK